MKENCSDCPLGPDVDLSRRSFLKGAGVMIGVAAFGFATTDAVALPVAFGTGTGGAGSSEHRYPIPDTDGVTIDRKNQVIVVRYQQHLYAFNLACPHENTALKWLPKDGRFQCPKHDSKYQPDGTFVSGHATRSMDRFAIRRDGDALVVDVARWFQSDRQPEAWAAARVDL